MVSPAGRLLTGAATAGGEEDNQADDHYGAQDQVRRGLQEDTGGDGALFMVGEGDRDISIANSNIVRC